MDKLDRLFNELDSWVKLHGNGNYFHPSDQLKASTINPIDGTIGSILEEHGIQQVRNEIKEFVEILLKLKRTDTMLEIGLGRYGSTHFLWRLIFNKIVTIEKNFERVRDFGRNTKKYYGKWILGSDKPKSLFLHGMSNEPNVVDDAYKILPDGVDVLFIDGDHFYKGVLTDWLLYSPLVKKGGIVAFHDSAFTQFSDVPLLMNNLIEGKIDRKKREIKQIIKSNICGIGYYIND